MENKYYTPEIEEFHVGFEYEARSTFGTGTPWMKDTVRYAEQIVALRINDPYKQGELRVKYLDREDIESEGWECTSRRSFPDKPPVLLFDMIINDKAYGISLRENSTFLEVIERDRRNGNHISNLFQGTIKNKSEFKKLLKQLGI